MLDRILGPRVPADLSADQLKGYRLPTMLFSGAALLLIISILLPYWRLDLWAPQFPGGLVVEAFVNRLQGDVAELEGLNHYVGLASFEDGAVFERSVAIFGILGLAGLLAASLVVHSRWVLALTMPALLFPIIFVVDLQWWLWNYGHNLDPSAPFAAAVGEFTPPIFGSAEIAQFDTTALPGPGLILAVIASVMIGFGLWHHRKAYKPLIEAGENDE